MPSRFSLLAAAILALPAAAAPLAAQAAVETGAVASKNIVETAAAAGSFNTLAAALEQAGLIGTLSGEGPFTVFAPTDEAFAKLPKADLDALMADKEQLIKVLTYHVVPGNIKAADLQTRAGSKGYLKAKTVEGSELKIRLADGNVRVGNDGASVVQADVDASNGVIHVIDQVILPSK
jgi:uncharacterized surface protein with fasciclin (FAS1) repeats